MMPNFIVIAACSLIPFFIAFIWFHPKVFGGDKWGQIANLTQDQINKPIKPIQLIASIFLNLLLSMGVFIITKHQTHVLALMGGPSHAEEMKHGTALAFMKEYGNNFNTFHHGITHGLFIGFLFFVVPILGYAVIFERKSVKYLVVNGGFWAISLILMACVISKWGGVPV